MVLGTQKAIEGCDGMPGGPRHQRVPRRRFPESENQKPQEDIGIIVEVLKAR
jgi:hypothetical protein